MPAVIAFSTGNVMEDHHAIANSKSLDLGPNCGNDAGSLMAKNTRRGVRASMDLLEVSAADPAGVHTDQDFSDCDLRNRNRLDTDIVDAAIDGCLHVSWNYGRVP